MCKVKSSFCAPHVLTVSMIFVLLCGGHAVAQKKSTADSKKSTADKKTSASKKSTASKKSAGVKTESAASKSSQKSSTSGKSDSAKKQSVSKGHEKAKAGSSTKSSSAKSRGVRQRLPRFYGQLKLKEDQRDKIYGIQAQYQKDIEDLQAKIAEIRRTMNKELEGVLTTTQKRALSKSRAAKK